MSTAKILLGIRYDMKAFRCMDAGIRCHWSASASDEDELMDMIKEHAGRNHMINEIPSDVYSRVRSAIRNIDDLD